MSLDLTPFARRVHAAVTTNQCLDYAADVTALMHEIDRLQRGYDALLDAREDLRTKAAVGRGITLDQMRQAGAGYLWMKHAVEVFERGTV